MPRQKSKGLSRFFAVGICGGRLFYPLLPEKERFSCRKGCPDMEERYFGAKLVFWSVLVLAVCGAFALFGSGGRKEETVNASAGPETKPVVILDPGHGGIDGGAVSRDGILEKDLNLAVSKELGRLLYAQGFHVVYTREDDTMPDAGRTGASRKMNDIAARLDVMKAYPDALFVSIHMNKYPGESPRGIQIYYAAKQEGSLALAEAIRSSALRIQPDNRRETVGKTDGIYLLEHASGTAVLIECGFLSNPTETEKLNDPAYRTRLAAYLCAGICSYAFPAEIEENNAV